MTSSVEVAEDVAAAYRPGQPLDEKELEIAGKADSFVAEGPVEAGRDEGQGEHRDDQAGTKQPESEPKRENLDRFGEFLPLKTLASLLAWEPKQEYVSRALYVPCDRLDRRQRAVDVEGEKDATKVICCHDMMGGYKGDRFVMGARWAHGTRADKCMNPYVFRHWPCIDGFIYFSHWFVTIPPPCWINAGHRHGCPVYGTIITEGEEGRVLLEELLSSRAKMERSVQQLVNIALYYRFEGWLINVENELSIDHVQSLLEFVELLTEAMHRAVAHSMVLWYDAVTVEGTLEWQNALTPLNKPFFDRCDGIWINYAWKEGDPNRIRDAAGDRRGDVYLGVDCFGRGSYGGGGLNTYVAVESAKNAALNVGLFAPAWPYEHYVDGDKSEGDGGDPQEGQAEGAGVLREIYKSWYTFDEEFWYRIDRVSNRRRPIITMLPFSTDFSVGEGSTYYSGGTIVGAGVSWYNMNLQSLQSTPWMYDSHHSNIYTCHVSRGAAFNRANCFVVEGGIGDPIRVRLYQTRIPMGGKPGIPGIGLTCTAALSKGINLRIALKISRRGRKDSIVVELDTAAPTSKAQRHASFASTWLVKAPSKQLSVGQVVLNTAEKDLEDVRPLEGSPWVTSDFGVLAVDLPGWVWEEGWITSIDAVIRPLTSGSMCKCHVALGNLAAWFLTEEFPPCQPVLTIFPEFVDLVAVRDEYGVIQSKRLSLVLIWEAPKTVRRFQVWYKWKSGTPASPWSKAEFLSAVTVPVYAISELSLAPNVVAVRFEARTEVGPFVQNSRTATKTCTIDFSSIR